MNDLTLQLRDYRLTTAEIIYRLPDHPNLLQTFVWQDLDIAPRFPVLHKFLAFWEQNLDGKLHTVRVATSSLVRPAEFRYAASVLTLQ
jgi:uncharacterized protein Usg